MHPRYAGIIQISLEGLFSAPPINGAPLENRLQRYNLVLNNARKTLFFFALSRQIPIGPISPISPIGPIYPYFLNYCSFLTLTSIPSAFSSDGTLLTSVCPKWYGKSTFGFTVLAASSSCSTVIV